MTVAMFEIVEMEMNVGITIKALRSRGGVIAWDYDNKRDAECFWNKLVKSGEAPDTGAPLQSANWWESGDQKKKWERSYDPEKHLAEMRAFCGL